jgi:hypothetical protein
MHADASRSKKMMGELDEAWSAKWKTDHGCDTPLATREEMREKLREYPRRDSSSKES